MHLLRKCPCPVWVVKPAKCAKYKRILAAVDTTCDFPDSARDSLNPLIMQLASSLARMDGSDLHLVQVWSVFAEDYLDARAQLGKSAIQNLRKDTKQQYISKLDSLLAGIDLKGVITHRHLLRSDETSRAIVKLAKKFDRRTGGSSD